MSRIKPTQRKGASTVKISLLRRFVMFWVHHLQQALGSLGELTRNPIASTMTVAVLGLSLTLPSTLYVLVKNSQEVTSGLENASEISLFLEKRLDQNAVVNFAERISLWDEVESTRIIYKDDALQEFRDYSGFGTAIDYLQDNPLPDVVLVTPKEQHRSAERARMLQQKLELEREVNSATLDVTWLNRLQALIQLVQDVLAAIALLLCSAVVLIVGNTIRLMILNRKEEIEVMKLVGATNAYIQRPFLYTGFWYGILGGFLAWVATALLVWWIGHAMTRVSELYESPFKLSGLSFNEVLILWGVAVVLGLLGSYVAVRRHVAKIEPQS
ncbi:MULTISPECIES: permease-like cell division protein FtsX [Gammaproteobacteria]|uniref:permease-like cell division protein FtsX n=1 Tax=Gammaproteobacteria TaxID=1236 RepID=UPI000DD08ABE|nr:MULTISPECIES: permease-like cell division protein FtsX [Gammaproteobacteria]RTE86511.1 cell division protein FtsX [Aliidiomarina sp. B3213]TCZ90934.1 cell division protein FtsX [Lysobacter sp. N42]